MKALFERCFPSPSLSLLLWLTWLLLNGFSPGHAVLGLVLAVLLPLGTRPFWPNVPGIRNLPRLGGFILVVLWDILVANLSVARKVLGPLGDMRPAFVEMPLSLEDDFAIALLTSTVSLTPGTVSADVSMDRKTLLIHALDVDDEQALIEEIRQRYERPLKEIFQC
ncbi:monovalent cation/H+ antiporter subunit E [Alcanivorax hongdengensis A-11-3]|uniref:Monovalent cation/H+ antiporter subunit E n=1 Tax=Alcanivorax hongdengensis A-11-3 TaxID=1177179 RepID=L0W8E9_9GAMM|nr:Na+/H+ antiporter subunit E [Alcanivorax hongdengensis]EKF72988.1 monovalent cation/H+ antiporter subunit E [Alcanivorax hongdengensis A-11-3]